MNKNAVIGLIGSLREKYGSFLERELAAHNLTGLVPSHGSVLSVLYQNEGRLSMTDIARKIGRTKSTVTELVERLVIKGFVDKQRSTQDKREVFVVLTEKGYGFRKDFEEISQRLIETAYRGFTEDEKELLVGYLLRMWENF